MQRYIQHMIAQAKEGAVKRGIYWRLTDEDVLRLVAASGFRCAITGIRFSFSWEPGWARRPWVPTIDRIESAGHYVPGNVRLVCFAANHAMREWGAGVFLHLVDACNEAAMEKARQKMRPQPVQLALAV